MSRSGLMRRIRRAIGWLAIGFAAAAALSFLAVLGLRYAPPATTAFIIKARMDSWFDDFPQPWKLRREWRAIEAISPQMALAVVAAEDQLFPVHDGFDFKQIRQAIKTGERTGRPRGASTISQQVAKNLFLWSGRSYVRKALEAWFTLLIEWLWPKQRILEMYLNIAEFGRGIYGVEAAAHAYYRIPAARLNREQSARLAAVLPNPRRMNAARPSRYVLKRQREIERQMRALGGPAYLDQIKQAP
jgi:monofunctional glycosyltransferase